MPAVQKWTLALFVFQEIELDTHPIPWQNPVNLHPNAVLELLSAWTVAPVESFSTGAQFLVLSFTYTRGGVGGAFDFQLWSSIYSLVGNAPAGAQEWAAPPIYASGAVVAGVDTQSLLQEEYQTYTPDAAGVHSFDIGPIPLRSIYERVRIRARESGAALTPGTLQISGVLW